MCEAQVIRISDAKILNSIRYRVLVTKYQYNTILITRVRNREVTSLLPYSPKFAALYFREFHEKILVRENIIANVLFPYNSTVITYLDL